MSCPNYPQPLLACDKCCRLQPSSSYFHTSWPNCLSWRRFDAVFLSLLALHQCGQTWTSSSLKIPRCLINFAHPLFVSFSGEAADAIDFFPPSSFFMSGGRVAQRSYSQWWTLSERLPSSQRAWGRCFQAASAGLSVTHNSRVITAVMCVKLKYSRQL